MGNLTFTEEYALKILRRLRRRLVRGDVRYKKYKKDNGKYEIKVELIAGDLGLPLTSKKREYIYSVEKYLRDKKLDFTVFFDFANKSLSESIDKDHPTESSVQVGMLMGYSLGALIKSIDANTRSHDANTISNEAVVKSNEALERKIDGFVSESKLNAIKDENSTTGEKKGLKSIHLVTESVAVKDDIWVVLDERYGDPINFNTKNLSGKYTYIKKLHDIAYPWNVPGKKVDYSDGVMKDINGALFRRRKVKEYMRTNKFKKPTLVGKAGDKKTFMLKSEIVHTISVSDVPIDYQRLYVLKTK